MESELRSWLGQPRGGKAVALDLGKVLGWLWSSEKHRGYRQGAEIFWINGEMGICMVYNGRLDYTELETKMTSHIYAETLIPNVTVMRGGR